MGGKLSVSSVGAVPSIEQQRKCRQFADEHFKHCLKQNSFSRKECLEMKTHVYFVCTGELFGHPRDFRASDVDKNPDTDAIRRPGDG